MPDKRTFRAEDARQGSIILNTPFKRVVFIGCLAAAVILVLLLIHTA